MLYGSGPLGSVKISLSCGQFYRIGDICLVLSLEYFNFTGSGMLWQQNNSNQPKSSEKF